MKLSVLPFPAMAGIALTGMILMAACGPTGNPPATGKIPVDDKRAGEHIISAAQGHLYIQSFKEAGVELKRQLKDSAFLPKSFQLPVAEAFNKDAIGALLNADSADGIRIYLGRDSAGQIRLVLVPIDKNGQDIITKLVPDSTADQGTQGNAPKPRIKVQAGQMVEIGQRCPTMCDSLNKN